MKNYVESIYSLCIDKSCIIFVLCCVDQDGIISPETDSGFVGSESSHLTPATVPSPLHQRASQRWGGLTRLFYIHTHLLQFYLMCRLTPPNTHTHTHSFQQCRQSLSFSKFLIRSSLFSVFECLNIFPWCDSVSVHQEGHTGRCQIGPVSAPSPASSPSSSCKATGTRGASQLSPDQPNRSRQRQRRRTFSYSPQRWVSHTEQTRADSGTSEFGLESDSSESPSSVHRLRLLLFFKTCSQHLKHVVPA